MLRPVCWTKRFSFAAVVRSAELQAVGTNCCFFRGKFWWFYCSCLLDSVICCIVL